MSNVPEAKALSNQAVVLRGSGCIFIMESQTEYEGESGAVVPAKSIWLNTVSAKLLRDFLIEQYPIEEPTT